MAGFFKNRARKKLLEQAFKGRQQGDGQLRRPVFPDVAGIRCVGILYKVESQEDLGRLEELAGWAGDKGYLVLIVAVETEKCFKDDLQRAGFVEELAARYDRGEVKVCFVGRKELSGIGVPKAGAIDSFLQQKLDILVSLNDNGNFTLEYLALKADAAFEVGLEPREAGHYDMVLAPASGMPAPAEYMQQLFDYLRNMNQEP